MKSLKISNLGEIRNELNKYKKGKKFDIHQFNQVARLAWLGKLVIQPWIRKTRNALPSWSTAITRTSWPLIS
jgi:hypothetical protein